jgi:hypothetical protein
MRGGFVMSEEINTMFTTEQVLQQAQGNLNAVCLGTIAYLKEHHQSPGDWSTSLGQRLAPGWESLRGHSAKEVVQIAALNCVSFGGKLRSLSGDESRAEAVIEGWPPEERLEFFHITQSDADLLWEAFKPIGVHLGLQIQCQRQGDTFKITVERRSR